MGCRICSNEESKAELERLYGVSYFLYIQFFSYYFFWFFVGMKKIDEIQRNKVILEGRIF